uniref:Uncharacterized protein n=1 Tax=Pipistrellus kuhlii TaxID=59472 RepID=A0A7J7YMF6_PIPKU|nr:hypothetical protein mPipKuh1_010138 [Pipistrellus kuhlii]
MRFLRVLPTRPASLLLMACKPTGLPSNSLKLNCPPREVSASSKPILLLAPYLAIQMPEPEAGKSPLLSCPWHLVTVEAPLCCLPAQHPQSPSCCCLGLDLAACLDWWFPLPSTWICHLGGSLTSGLPTARWCSSASSTQ